MGAVFKNCRLSEMVYNGLLNLPSYRQLPDLNVGENDSFLEGVRIQKDMSYVIVADDAFPLNVHIMKLYAHNNLTEGKRMFDYRL